MCSAIQQARDNKLITSEERIDAFNYIVHELLNGDYLSVEGMLTTVFSRRPLDSEIKEFWEQVIGYLKVKSEQKTVPWYETEEGQEWLSNQPSIEEQFEASKNHNISIGQRYIFNDIDCPTLSTEYILANAGVNAIALINLSNGNRYADSVRVNRTFDISKDEWNKITGGDAKHFTLKTEN